VSEKSWQMNKTLDKWADERLTQPKETSMLWTIIVILVVLWLLGFIGHFGGGLIHLLLVIAVIVLVIQLIQGRRGL
jgi:fatty acid desaturase